MNVIQVGDNIKFNGQQLLPMATPTNKPYRPKQYARRGRPPGRSSSNPRLNRRTVSNEPDPLENLPKDMEGSFANWFYGPPGWWRRHTKENPLRDLGPIVQRYLPQEPALEPQSLSFLTENINSEEPEPVKEVTTYKIIANKRVKSEPLSDKKKASDSTETSNTKDMSIDVRIPNLHNHESCNQDQGDIPVIDIIVNSFSTIVDRRNMLLKKEKVSDRPCVVKLVDGEPLIDPSENCDSDKEGKEIEEIDCDNPTFA